jgi:hypothetical protein
VRSAPHCRREENDTLRHFYSHNHRSRLRPTTPAMSRRTSPLIIQDGAKAIRRQTRREHRPVMVYIQGWSGGMPAPGLKMRLVSRAVDNNGQVSRCRCSFYWHGAAPVGHRAYFVSTRRGISRHAPGRLTSSFYHLVGPATQVAGGLEATVLPSSKTSLVRYSPTSARGRETY